MATDSLKTLFIDELRDLYDAEQQLIKALPKMAEASNSPELRSGFEEHLEQTKNHARRIEQIMDAIGESPKGKKCKGMQGLVSEGSETIKEKYDGAVSDSAVISAAQRVEHYEIAAYGCVRDYAELLGETEAASLLSQTLEEEKQTDEKLTTVAEQINREALSQAGETTRRRAKSAGAY
ncbi:MAG TPA: ferritin-like domain-containing protein [Candidatus Acidoferrales bacterium]|nr:ferritin-like domain-containing protein [Candidatus Acidoferrales bacterium]